MNTQNIHVHHLPPGCKVSLQQSVGGGEASIVDADIDSAQVRMGFYPGEQRSNVLLLGQVALTVIKLNKISISQAPGVKCLTTLTFPASPAKVLESSSSFSSLLAQPTTLMPALIKSKQRYLTPQICTEV